MNSNPFAGYVVILGGKGALGSRCITTYKLNHFWIANVDNTRNPEAHANILIDPNTSLQEQEQDVVSRLAVHLHSRKVDAIICVAGGWIDGNGSKELCKNSELMFNKNVWSSLIATSLACMFLKPEGILILTGAQTGLCPTPTMIGYGISKAAVHHLVKSLGQQSSGLPPNAIATAILPVILDTPMNRKSMPYADLSTWTPLEFVADLILSWTYPNERPFSGSLCQLITKNYQTDLILL